MLPTTISQITTPTIPASTISSDHNIVTPSDNVSIAVDDNIELWDENRVFQWALKNRQGQYYADILLINHIDGRALLNLSEKDISLMGISIGPGKNLLADIHSIKYKRNINWAYEKVTDFNDFVQLYFPFHRLKEIGTDGLVKVKDYSVASYTFIKDNLGTIGNYMPSLNKSNSILPDRNPLLLQNGSSSTTSQPIQLPPYQLPTQPTESTPPVQLFNLNEQQQKEQLERQEIIQLQHQLLNESPNHQQPIFDQHIVGQQTDEEYKNQTN